MAAQAGRGHAAARPRGAAIRYRIEPVDPAAHLFEVELAIDAPAAAGQVLALPAWIPGSYMIREFARNIVAIEARAGRQRVDLEKLDKHTWRARPARAPLVVTYRVYAWDLSVRGAHLDPTHGFFNGTSVFLRVIGAEDQPVLVDIAAPRGERFAGWRVATAMTRAGAAPGRFGRHRAESYDELIDHPVEMGEFASVTFEAGGARHEVAITGRQDADLDRLAGDLARVCQAQVRLFEPQSRRAPFDRYVFLVTAVGDGYGGLEHRASTALLCARGDLPPRGLGAVTDSYRNFLGLASHEYFHAWHVKRIKPAAFARYDLDREQYTRLLWVFEGFTSYYDDLMLVRSGTIEPAAYLRALSTTISGVLRGPGRRLQSIADSSFDAWTKYYRQDENAANAIVSYYAKGSLVALALDLAVRSATRGTRSLDDLMRLLWRRHGRDFHEHGRGVPEDAMPALLTEATGVDLSAEIAGWAYGTEDPPLEALLARVGLKLELAPGDGGAASLGIRSATRGSDLVVATAYAGGAAHAAGLSAGDVVVAVDGLRVDEKALKALLARRKPGQRVEIHAFRRDELMRFEVVLQPAPAVEASIAPAARATAAALRLQRGWLGAATRPLRRRA